MGVRVTDNFNRANENPLANPPWSSSGGGSGQVISNQLLGQFGSDNFPFYNADSPPADHYSKITFISTANAGSDTDDGGPCVRMSSSANGYLFNVESNSNPSPPLTNWHLFSLVGGSGTPMASGTIAGALSSGDIIECRAVGNLISGYINGSLIGSATDGTYTTGGYGVHIFGAGSPVTSGIWDNFEGGDFGGGGCKLPLLGVG
jgi:hypothetical protein